jgi:hypothetical protein
MYDMAKQKGNVVTHGLSGTVGGMLVFRQTAAGTVVQSPPRVSGKVSEAQRAQRRRFQHAVLYAGVAVSNPETGGIYAAKAGKSRSVRMVTIADYLCAPEIERVDVSDYHGRPGDVIRIEAIDDVAVKEVKVVITGVDGTPVEEGFAVPEATGYEWTYTATTVNDSLTGDRIEVYASDLPGNITKAEEVL